MSIDARFQPLKQWPGTLRTSRLHGGFKSPTLDRATRDVLYEAEKMGGMAVTLFVAVKREAVRHDGMLYSNAVFAHPGVMVEIDMGPGRKPRRFATDKYTHAASNLRAIAMVMEDLRHAGMRGVFERDEQYVGFEALPPGQSEAVRENAPDFASASDAAVFLLQIAESSEGVDAVLEDQDVLQGIYRRAVKRVHPDLAAAAGRAGDPEKMRLCIAAKDVIEAAQPKS